MAHASNPYGDGKACERIVEIYELLKLIGKKRGAVISGGEIDEEKTANIILADFRSGKLGNITLEKVNEK